MGHAGLAGGNHLPAVAGDLGRPSGRIELGGGGQPADVAHIRRAGAIGIGRVIGHHKVVDGLISMVGQLNDLLFEHGVGLRAVAGQAIVGVGLAKLGREVPLLLGILRQRGFHQIVVEQLLQDGIGQGIGGAVQLVPGDGGAGHEGRALGNVIDPGQQGLGLADGFRPDHIDELRRGLHHIGGNAPCIGDGIVDRALGLHMLPQELNAYVHQLRAVQGGTALPGVACGVGSGARELIDHLQAGSIGAGGDLIGVAGVPGDGGIQVLEQTVSGHKGLAGAALLAGAAIEDDCAMELSGCDLVFDGNGRTEARRAQQIVAAALAAAALAERLLFGHTGGLGQAGQGVIFRQNADFRAAGAVGSGKGRRNTAEILFHLEALLLQQGHIGGSGLDFQHGQLGIFPYLVTEGENFLFFRFNGLVKLLLAHITAPSSGSPGAGDGWDC